MSVLLGSLPTPRGELREWGRFAASATIRSQAEDAALAVGGDEDGAVAGRGEAGEGAERSGKQPLDTHQELRLDAVRRADRQIARHRRHLSVRGDRDQRLLADASPRGSKDLGARDGEK